MQLYILDTKYDLGKIEECEVIKETEKTYIIKRKAWGTNVIRKSQMQFWNYIVCKSYDEALERLKIILEHKIETSECKIKQLKNDIERYNTMLADIEKGM